MRFPAVLSFIAAALALSATAAPIPQDFITDLLFAVEQGLRKTVGDLGETLTNTGDVVKGAGGKVLLPVVGALVGTIGGVVSGVGKVV